MENTDIQKTKSIEEVESELKTKRIPRMMELIRNIDMSIRGDSNNGSDEENSINKPNITQKEIILNEVLNEIPEEDIKKIINSLDEETVKDEENGKENTAIEVSGLNPKSELITDKDPDELIMLPNDELRKTYNKKNRNQPL